MLKIINPGFYSTIQDSGRFGYRNKGVPISGTMDAYSASIANSLLENEESAAVMEITMIGPKVEFEKSTFIALAGADLSPTINGNDIANYQIHQVESGSILEFGKLVNGIRCYLAIKDGFQTEEILGSRSYYMPITKLNRILQYMEIPYNSSTEFNPKISNVKASPFHKLHELKGHQGPEYELLTTKQKEILFSNDFTVAKENNRMAYQLEELLQGHEKTMLTSATLPGTVQLTPLGKILILMRDGQTTGGYPRIFQLTPKSISLLSQKKSRDTISFSLANGYT